MTKLRVWRRYFRLTAYQNFKAQRGGYTLDYVLRDR